MSDAEWIDEGPYSQGKIITAILQDDEDKARFMMRHWSPDDLRKLVRASDRLGILGTQEHMRRGRP